MIRWGRVNREMWYTLLAFAVLFLIVALAGNVFAIDLYHNQTFTFNFTNEENASKSEVFYCPAVPEINETSLCNATRIIDINLSAGGAENITTGSCDVRAVCAAASTSEGSGPVCVLDKTLRPGNTYSFTDGACDVSIKVDRYDDDDLESGEKRILVDTVIERDGNTVEVKVGDVRRTYDILDEDIFLETQIPFICPTSVAIDELADESAVLESCRRLLPDVIDTMSETVKGCSESAWSHVNAVVESSKEERKVRNELVGCQAELSGRQADLNNERNVTIPNLTAQLDEAEKDRDLYLALLIGLAIAAAGLVVVCFMSFFDAWGIGS